MASRWSVDSETAQQFVARIVSSGDESTFALVLPMPASSGQTVRGLARLSSARPSPRFTVVADSVQLAGLVLGQLQCLINLVLMLELTIAEIISVMEIEVQCRSSILSNPNTQQGLFVHELISNGLIISTCSICQKIFASPKPAHLTMVEASHKCIGQFSPDRAQRLTCSILSGRAINDCKKSKPAA